MAEGGEDGAPGDVDEHEPGIVWACTECGRHHQKHSPPCNRCGNVELEKRRPEYSDLAEPGGTSYLDVLEPKYALGYLAVIGFGVLVVLSMAGVVSVPWLGGPSPPGAPGAADSYENVSLQAVEDAYVEGINEQRAERDVGALSVDDRLDDVATAFTQRSVRAASGDGESPDLGEMYQRYEPACEASPASDAGSAAAADVFGDGAGSGTTDAATVASNLPIAAGGETLLAERYDAIGVDVHVGPDDRVFVTVIVC